MSQRNSTQQRPPMRESLIRNDHRGALQHFSSIAGESVDTCIGRCRYRSMSVLTKLVDKL